MSELQDGLLQPAIQYKYWSGRNRWALRRQAIALDRLTSPQHPDDQEGRPLVVDLDGTLIRSDLLIECAFSELSHRPHAIVEMVRALGKGKANLKHRLSEPRDFDPAVLPYDPEVLKIIQQASQQGRAVYLASASHERLVSAVAEHLGLFTGWFATDATTNCAGEVKAEILVGAFGEGGFDYIGNDRADLPVWRRAATAYAIRTPAKVARQLSGECRDVEHLAHDRPTWRTWARMLRVHQYAKNGLVFVPLLANHLFAWASVWQVLLAAIAFSLCASSVYLLNDLVDLQDDRAHRTKCRRPLACGDIPLSYALMAIPLLLCLAFVSAAFISTPFLAVLAGYFALTTAYSFFLKRKMILDVVALAGLYTTRVIGGAVALSVAVSPWLLAFMMSWFLSLALVKRYVELLARKEANLPDSKSRDYRNDDVGMVGALAAAAGVNALTLFSLYISSEDVRSLYTRPEILWLVAPILTYWIARVLMLAHRGQMHDDPVVFALKDKVSLISLGAVSAFMVGAM
ncbi:membrane protein [Pseudorhizobium endolithicum]|uniref:Membrane protein n=1 Tax=Pseudorhizobium endolithicum TaxID=1191678 RepID=A0ABN7JYH0_9HYPH|nr:membrane protein [Pseudorhizobium endolithicum]